MPSALDLRDKITSINNTKKITGAMQLVSAVKMRKLQQKFGDTEHYLSMLKEVISDVFKAKPDMKSPLLMEYPDADKNLIVIVGTSRGFVGSQLSRLAAIVYQNLTENNTLKNEIVTLRQKTLKIMSKYGISSDFHFSETFELTNISEISTIKSLILDKYSTRKYRNVYVAYTNYLNSSSQVPVFEKILPLSIDSIKMKDMSKNEISSRNEQDSNIKGVAQFEPSVEEVFDKILTDYMEVLFSRILISSAVSEYIGRMYTMQTATKNAEELSEALNLEYNRSRQSAITQQIQENINANII